MKWEKFHSKRFTDEFDLTEEDKQYLIDLVENLNDESTWVFTQKNQVTKQLDGGYIDFYYTESYQNRIYDLKVIHYIGGYSVEVLLIQDNTRSEIPSQLDSLFKGILGARANIQRL